MSQTYRIEFSCNIKINDGNIGWNTLIWNIYIIIYINTVIN